MAINPGDLVRVKKDVDLTRPSQDFSLHFFFEGARRLSHNNIYRVHRTLATIKSGEIDHFVYLEPFVGLGQEEPRFPVNIFEKVDQEAPTPDEVTQRIVELTNRIAELEALAENENDDDPEETLQVGDIIIKDFYLGELSRVLEVVDISSEGLLAWSFNPSLPLGERKMYPVAVTKSERKTFEILGDLHGTMGHQMPRPPTVMVRPPVEWSNQ